MPEIRYEPAAYYHDVGEPEHSPQTVPHAPAPGPSRTPPDRADLPVGPPRGDVAALLVMATGSRAGLKKVSNAGVDTAKKAWKDARRTLKEKLQAAKPAVPRAPLPGPRWVPPHLATSATSNLSEGEKTELSGEETMLLGINGLMRGLAKYDGLGFSWPPDDAPPPQPTGQNAELFLQRLAMTENLWKDLKPRYPEPMPAIKYHMTKLITDFADRLERTRAEAPAAAPRPALSADEKIMRNAIMDIMNGISVIEGNQIKVITTGNPQRIQNTQQFIQRIAMAKQLTALYGTSPAIEAHITGLHEEYVAALSKARRPATQS